MKKLFIWACLVLCLIPSVGMLFFPTTRTSENKPMASAPALTAPEGGLNSAFFTQFETWFTQRLALRNQMVYADAMVQTNLFRQSNVDGVVMGTDGWLYYTDTVRDFLGTDVLTERELFQLAHNFAVVEQYLQARNIDFVLTVAPNKNTLYGENMPYHKSVIADPDHSAVLLAPYLQAQNVPYLDLFQLFEARDEILYLKGDSHWNNKGAYLVYGAIADALNLPATQYPEPEATVNENGDLNRMLYGFYGTAEPDYRYALPGNYTMVKGSSVEDGWIETENPNGNGTILMFRDSFANNLIPFFSEQFATAYYSKGEPNALEWYVESCSPDAVVIQKVERNITNYLYNPPVITAPQTQLPAQITIAQTDTVVSLEKSETDMQYYCISGTADPSRITADSRITVQVAEQYYQAYLTGDNSFLLYVKKADIPATDVKLQVYAVTDDACTQLLSTQVSAPN